MSAVKSHPTGPEAFGRFTSAKQQTERLLTERKFHLICEYGPDRAPWHEALTRDAAGNLFTVRGRTVKPLTLAESARFHRVRLLGACCPDVQEGPAFAWWLRRIEQALRRAA